jgi:hypothetical protein
VDGEQRYRWVISALMEIEQRQHKANRFSQLHRLADAFEKYVLLEPENFN